MFTPLRTTIVNKFHTKLIMTEIDIVKIVNNMFIYLLGIFLW